MKFYILLIGLTLILTGCVKKYAPGTIATEKIVYKKEFEKDGQKFLGVQVDTIYTKQYYHEYGYTGFKGVFLSPLALFHSIYLLGNNKLYGTETFRAEGDKQIYLLAQDGTEQNTLENIIEMPETGNDQEELGKVTANRVESEIPSPLEISANLEEETTPKTESDLKTESQKTTELETNVSSETMENEKPEIETETTSEDELEE